MAKDQWTELPDMQYPHQFYPSVSLTENENVIVVAGHRSKYSPTDNKQGDREHWGMIECLDTRENTNRWNVLKIGNRDGDLQALWRWGMSTKNIKTNKGKEYRLRTVQTI